MKIALLKGNRFNPWHLQGFRELPGDWETVAFRAESEIQERFAQRQGEGLTIRTEPVHFDIDTGPFPRRMVNSLLTRYRGRESRIVPFYERLQGYDVILTWETWTDWTNQAMEARARYDVPVAVMVWDNIAFNMEQDPVRRAIKQRVREEADRFLVYTERSRRVLMMEGAAADRITMLNPGIDTTAFAPGQGNRAAFGLDPDDFVILYVGWLVPRKGLDFLVQAVHQLLADSPDTPVKLLIAGSGPGKDRIDHLLQRLGLTEICVFLDSRPYSHMPELFRTADVFALPSIATPEWQEQFGMALIEAMATGLPCVAARTGCVDEVAGDCAVLCQPNDFLTLYQALARLMASPDERARLGAAARERARARYRLEEHARALADVFGELTATPG